MIRRGRNSFVFVAWFFVVVVGMMMMITTTTMNVLSSSSSSSSSGGRNVVSTTMFAMAKEMEVTAEWQLIGENDTLPAGMHVRMDLTTGEKWVKLPSNDDDNDDNSNANANDKKSTTQTTSTNDQAEYTVSATGSVDPSSAASSATTTTTSLSIISEDSNQESNGNKNKERKENLKRTNKQNDGIDGAAEDADHEEGDDEAPDYDYEMMHRTLLQLPPEEQARMGGIPQLPSSQTTTTTTRISLSKNNNASHLEEQRLLWEQKMRDIWERRQAELREFEKSNVANLPQILKDRIHSIQQYIQYGSIGDDDDDDDDDDAKLKAATVADLDDDDDDADDDDDDNDNKRHRLNNIVEVLADLEYLVTDIDMARDFHTLGGWPLVVSLLDPRMHAAAHSRMYRGQTAATKEEPVDDEIRKWRYQVQSKAAWVLGTAVKNTEEFQSWCLEKAKLVLPEMTSSTVDRNNQTTTTVSVSALELLQDAIQNELEAFQQQLQQQQQSSSLTKERQRQWQQKLLYALGSFLRGNPQAQVQFVKTTPTTTVEESPKRNGPTLLAQLLQSMLETPPAHPHSNEDTIVDSSKDDKAMKIHSSKMIQRILSLVSDVMLELQQWMQEQQEHLPPLGDDTEESGPRVVIPEEGSGDLNSANHSPLPLLSSLITAQEAQNVQDAFLQENMIWCNALESVLRQETNRVLSKSTMVALQAFSVLGPHCCGAVETETKLTTEESSASSSSHTLLLQSLWERAQERQQQDHLQKTTTPTMEESAKNADKNNNHHEFQQYLEMGMQEIISEQS